MADQTYEGWTNVETWAVALVIDNDEPVLRSFVAFAQVALAKKRDAHDLGRVVQVQVRNLADVNAPRHSTSMRSALARAALARVNWRELAEHYMAKAAEAVR